MVKAKKKRRYVVEHIDVTAIMGREMKPNQRPIVLERTLNESRGRIPMLDRGRLVSLVPAGSDLPPGTYLATWEVTE